MNNMKKAMVFGVALLMVLTVFAAMPAPTKAAQFTLFGFIKNTDGSVGDNTTANSFSTVFGWRDAAPTEISTNQQVYPAEDGNAAYEYSDHGSQWPTGPAAGQEVCLSFEVINGVNGWTGGNQSGGSHATIASDDITNSETDLPDTQLNDLPDPYKDGDNMVWDAFSNDPQGILSGYEIWESTDNSDGSYVKFDWVAAGTTSYALSSLTSGNYYKIGFSYLYEYNTTALSDVPYHNVVAAHTATATGPTNTAASNVASITITYNYDAGTTSVDLYYTTDGGNAWTQIGSDSSIDGSYDWTIPGDGTYGWIAVADGESAPAAGDAPEASSYTYDGTAPTVSSTTPADSATGVAVGTNVVVDFSESMDTSVNPTLSGGSVSYSAVGWNNDHEFEWSHGDWAMDSDISLTVDGAKDVAGNAQTAYSWSFHTAADSQPPVVTIGTLNNIEGGADQTVTATVNDTGHGDSVVSGAKYTVIAPSGMVAIDNATMDATDGAYDEISEDVTATFSTVGWAVGTYTVFVYGTAGAQGSDSGTYNESDTTAPTFSYDRPSDGANVPADQNISVYVYINDANHISDIDNSTVVLHWTNDGWSTSNDVAMTYVDHGSSNTVKYVGGRWTANIPGQSDGTTINYNVDAADSQGNSATGPTYGITASATSMSDPYPVYGYIYLYNGSAGGYNPLICDGTAWANADVYVAWVNSSSGATENVTVTTDNAGKYQVDLRNYSDGGSITVTAIDTGNNARYNVNTTTIDISNGGSMVNVTFGIPSRLNFTDPTNPPVPSVSSGTSFNVEYTIYDAHGVIAPGFYGTIHMVTDDSDPGVNMPGDLTFDGVGGGVGDGQASPGSATLVTAGVHYLNITETSNDMTPVALYPEAGQWWDQIDIRVTGLEVSWDLSAPGWHICSMPVVPVGSSDSAFEIIDLINTQASNAGVTLNDITIASRQTGTSPSQYDSAMLGGAGVDFAIEVGSAYWVFVDQGFGSVTIQGDNYTTTDGTFTKSIDAGWNMIGIAHNFTGNGVVDFEANTHPGVAGAGAYITYSAGTPGQPWPGSAWYISYWDVGTQSYDTYVYNFNVPTDSQNHQINLMSGATGFWLFVPGGGSMTYSVEN